MKSQFNLFSRGLPLRIAITFSCQLAFVLFGYDQGVFSGIVGNADFLDTFGHPDSGLEGIIVSIYNLGCFSGCILAFFVCEKLGRRKSMWLAMVFIIVSVAVQGVDGRARKSHSARAHVPRSERYSKPQPSQSLIS
jgi:MFS family permease